MSIEKKKQNRTQLHTFTFRMTDAENDRLNATMESLQYEKRKRFLIDRLDGNFIYVHLFKDVANQIADVGNHTNQIAKHINTIAKNKEQLIKEARDLLELTCDELRKANQTLGEIKADLKGLR